MSPPVREAAGIPGDVPERRWAWWVGGALGGLAGILWVSSFREGPARSLPRWVPMGSAWLALAGMAVGLADFVRLARMRVRIWGTRLTWSSALGLAGALAVISMVLLIVPGATGGDLEGIPFLLVPFVVHLLGWASLGSRWDDALRVLALSLVPFCLLVLASFSLSTLVFDGIPSVHGLWLVVGLATAGFWRFSRMSRWVGRLQARKRGQTVRAAKAVIILTAVCLATCLSVRQVWHRRVLGHEHLLRSAGFRPRFADFHFNPGARDAHPRLTLALKGPIPQGRQEIRHQGLWMAFGNVTRELGSTPWGDGTRGRIAKLQSDWPEYLQYVETRILGAARGADAWTPLDFSGHAAFEKSMPNYSGLVNVARVLEIEACEAALADRAGEAWNRVRDQVQLTNLILPQPLIIASMITVANQGITVATAATLLLHIEDSALPADIEREFRRWMTGDPVASGFEAETANALEMHSEIHGGGDRPHFNGGEWVQWLYGRLFDTVGAFDIDLLTTVSLIAPVPYWRSANTYEERAQPAEWLPRFGAGIPKFAGLTIKGKEARVRAQLVVIYSALKEHHRRAGTYPRALSVLVPGVAGQPDLVDPFGGGTLFYRASGSGSGFELASAGWRGTRMDTKEHWLSIQVGSPSAIFPPVVGSGYGDGPASHQPLVVGLNVLRDKAITPLRGVDWLQAITRDSRMFTWGESGGSAAWEWEANGGGRLRYRTGREWGTGVALSVPAGAPVNAAGAGFLVAEVTAPAGLRLTLNLNESGYDPAAPAGTYAGKGLSGADGEQFSSPVQTGTGRRQKMRIALMSLGMTDHSNHGGLRLLDAQAVGGIEISILGKQGDGIIEVHHLGFE